MAYLQCHDGDGSGVLCNACLRAYVSEGSTEEMRMD